MENRSHALIAGLFTLILLAAAAFIVVWLNRDSANLVPYDLVTVDSVQGLSPQADVRYRGMPVGKVQSIRFEPGGSGAMLVRIGVSEGTPMTDTLRATVEMKGVTGVAYVDLDDEGELGRPLISTPDNVARIRMQPGLTERLMNRATEVMGSLQRIGNQVAALLGPENQAAVTLTLKNTAQATEQANALMKQLAPAAEEVAPMLRSLNATATEASAAAREIASLAGGARNTLAALNGPGGLVDEATRSVVQIRRATAELAGAVPQLSGMANDVGQAAQSAARTLQSVERSPQSLLFGPPPARPGPGEPGFSGFGAQ